MTYQLPPLDTDCLHCTGPAGEQLKRENAEQWRKWSTDDQAAYAAFVAEYEKANRYGGAYEAWLRTDDYRELEARKPEELSEVGCVECEWTGKQITDAGRQVLDFLGRHTKLTAK